MTDFKALHAEIERSFAQLFDRGDNKVAIAFFGHSYLERYRITEAGLKEILTDEGPNEYGESAPDTDRYYERWLYDLKQYAIQLERASEIVKKLVRQNHEFKQQWYEELGFIGGPSVWPSSDEIERCGSAGKRLR